MHTQGMPLWQFTTIEKLATLGSPWQLFSVKVLWRTSGIQAYSVKRLASDQNLQSAVSQLGHCQRPTDWQAAVQHLDRTSQHSYVTVPGGLECVCQFRMALLPCRAQHVRTASAGRSQGQVL